MHMYWVIRATLPHLVSDSSPTLILQSDLNASWIHLLSCDFNCAHVMLLERKSGVNWSPTITLDKVHLLLGQQNSTLPSVPAIFNITKMSAYSWWENLKEIQTLCSEEVHLYKVIEGWKKREEKLALKNKPKGILRKIEEFAKKNSRSSQNPKKPIS